MSQTNDARPGRATKNAGAKSLWKANNRIFEVCDWSNVSSDAVHSFVRTITERGGACMFGLTSDGGAFSICVLYGDQKIKEYPHTPQECEALMGSISEFLADS